jgi:transposase
MAQVRTWAAFDVHVNGVVAAILDRDRGELSVRRLPGSSEAVAGFAAELPGPVRATYEAGPTGFVLARRLEAVGVDCVVCAPGLIPRGRVIVSRPIVVTPSAWSGCWRPVSCIA